MAKITGQIKAEGLGEAIRGILGTVRQGTMAEAGFARIGGNDTLCFETEGFPPARTAAKLSNAKDITLTWIDGSRPYVMCHALFQGGELTGYEETENGPFAKQKEWHAPEQYEEGRHIMQHLAA